MKAWPKTQVGDKDVYLHRKSRRFESVKKLLP